MHRGPVFTAWTRACLRAAPNRWASAIGAIPTLRLLEPALLPVKALLFVLSINRYQRTALSVQRRPPQRWYPQFVSVIASSSRRRPRRSRRARVCSGSGPFSNRLFLGSRRCVLGFDGARSARVCKVGLNRSFYRKLVLYCGMAASLRNACKLAS